MQADYRDFIGFYSSCLSRETCARIIKDAEPLFEAQPRKVVTQGAEQMPTFEFGRFDYSFNATLHLPATAKIIDDVLQAVRRAIRASVLRRQADSGVEQGSETTEDAAARRLPLLALRALQQGDRAASARVDDLLERHSARRG